jgi:hypothetical protein
MKAITILLALLIIPAAFAAYQVTVHTHEFKLTSEDNSDYLYLCACTPRVDTYTIDNIGEFDADFHVNIDSAKTWIKTSETDFRLKAGEKHQIFVYMEPPCNSYETTTYTITAESNFGRKAIITKNIETKPCQNIKVYDTEIAPAEPCQVMHFPLVVENVGGFREQYTLTFDKYSEFVDSSAYSFALEPGQQQNLEVYAKLSCEISGDIELPFTVSAKTNGNTEKFSVILPIKRSYYYEMSTPRDKTLCADVQDSIILHLENKMPFAQEITLQNSGTTFSKLENDSIKVSANSTIDVPVSVKPGKSDIGSHLLKINTRNTYSNTEKTSVTTLNVENCYDVSMTPPETKDPIICGEQELTFNVRNRGTREIVLGLSNNGADFLTYMSSISLLPGENKDVKIKANVPCKDANYTITLSAIDDTGVAKSESTFKIRALSRETAYGIQIINPKVQWYYDTTILPIILKNTGIRGGQYTIRLDSQLVGINITGVHLLPGEEKAIHLLPRIGIEEYESGRYVNAFTIEQTDEHITFGRDLEVKLKHHDKLDEWLKGAIYRQNYRSLGTCGIMTIVALLIIAGSIVLLVAFTSGKIKLSRRKIRDRNTLNISIALLAGIGVAILAVLILARAPDTSAWYEGNLTSNNTLVHVWGQDRTYQINLTEYFVDPDKDNLTFTSSQPADVDVHIKGTNALLTPRHGWSGTNRIVFTAYDAKGGSADSELMTLNIVRMKPVGWVDKWSAYCNHINYTLFAIIVFLIAAILITYRAKKDKIHAEQVARVRRR